MCTLLLFQSGQTVLHAAVMGQLPRLLRSIITRLRVAVPRAKVKELLNHRDEDNRTALHTAAAKGLRVRCGCDRAVSQWV